MSQAGGRGDACRHLPDPHDPACLSFFTCAATAKVLTLWAAAFLHRSLPLAWETFEVSLYKIKCYSEFTLSN